MIKKMTIILVVLLLSVTAQASQVANSSSFQTIELIHANLFLELDQPEGLFTPQNCESSFDPTTGKVMLAAGCCKICRKGKACGDSCISRKYDCHKPPGCACDG